jgi:transposase
MSKTTVSNILNKCRDHNITSEKATDENSGYIIGLIYPSRGAVRKASKKEPDWDEVHRRLTTTRHNLSSLWEEYAENCEDVYSYSQFCQRYNNWNGSISKLRMVQNPEPGEIIYVDWTGDKLACVLAHNARDKMQTAHFFVGVLAFSSYAHVEAFPDEKQRSWSLAHIHMFERFSGSTAIITSDNCRTSIAKANLRDPEKNPIYSDLADHYNTAIVPTRIYRPTDKGTVVCEVKYYETWIIQKVADRVEAHGAFYSFVDLNQFVEAELQKLMLKNFTNRPGSRLTIFTQVEKPTLRPLPQAPFDVLERKELSVPSSYHIPYLDHYYSVPHTLFKQKVSLVAGLNTIKVYDKAGVMVAFHQISADPFRRYVTLDEHMPKNHLAYRDYCRQDGAYYRLTAKTIGPNCYALIDALLTRDKYEETAYKSCQAIISAAKNSKIGRDRVELTCAKCISIGAIRYASFKSILDKKLESASVVSSNSAITAHDNLRNPNEFI